MKVKGRTLLVAALLLFGGYAYYDFKRDQRLEEQRMYETRLMTVEFQQVDKVEIIYGTRTILLQRTVDGWNLEQPLQEPADNTAVEDLIKNTAAERIIDVVKEGDDIDWALFGLDKPMGSVAFVTSAGVRDTFEISEKKNFEDNVYARKNKENRLLLINSIWQNKLQREVIEYRDRRFLKHSIASVDKINLKNSTGHLILERKEGQWGALDRADIKLDQNKVRELLQKISEAQATEFIEGGATAPQLKSLFDLELTMADKTWKANVGQAKDFSIYALVRESEKQMKLAPGALDDLIKLELKNLQVEPAKPQETQQKKDGK